MNIEYWFLSRKWHCILKRTRIAILLKKKLALYSTSYDSGSDQSVLPRYAHLSQQNYELGITVKLILHMRKLRHRQVFATGHSGSS